LYRSGIAEEYAQFVPELRHLRYFIAVAEELNFSRAAQRLHMAQPPLSVAIRNLEEELGVTLLERSTRVVRLTEAGGVFLEGARRTVAEADAAFAAAKRTASGDLGTLRVGYNWSARFETLPALGKAFSAQRPEVELLTEEMRPNRMVAALRGGAIDVAVALFPDVVGELSYKTIRREPIVAVLSEDHPLAGEEAIELRALADEFLLFPREVAPRLHDFYANLCRNVGFEPKQGRESSRTRWTLGTWDSATAALYPASVALELPDGVVAVAIDGPSGELETQLVWRTDDRGAALIAFIGMADSLFGIRPSLRSRAPEPSAAGRRAADPAR
jgi:LysR family transcriptional regulator, benzoate and cis,cis-muconate-responsive activator of ben and cat genes